MLFPVTRMLQRKCGSFNPQVLNTSSQSTLMVLPMFIRFCLVTLSGLIVCLVPNFSTLMNIIGAVFGTLLAFIMPGICHYAIFKNNINRTDAMMDYMLVIIGCIGCILGVLEALYGETPDNADAIILNKNHVHNLIQNAPKGLQGHENASDIASAIHPSGDHNVIETDSKIQETLANSISLASSAVTDKLSAAMTKIGSIAK